MKYRNQNEILKQLKELVTSEKTLIGHRTEYGYKYKNGIRAVEEPLCIRVFVDKKKTKEELGDRVIPERIGFFYTDVIELQDHQTHQTPEIAEFMEKLTGGAQIVNSNLWDEDKLESSNLGTLGCFVIKNNKYYGLTCYHVLYGIQGNGGNNGKVHQPANPSQVIGKATKSEDSINSNIDSSIFMINEHNINLIQSIHSIDGLISDNKNPLVGDEVFKYGATTKLTHGLIDGVGINDNRFTIAKKNASDPHLSRKGDSGAVWATNEGNMLRGVGLHSEGKNGVFATAVSLVNVFRELKITHISQSQINI